MALVGSFPSDSRPGGQYRWALFWGVVLEPGQRISIFCISMSFVEEGCLDYLVVVQRGITTTLALILFEKKKSIYGTPACTLLLIGM